MTKWNPTAEQGQRSRCCRSEVLWLDSRARYALLPVRQAVYTYEQCRDEQGRRLRRGDLDLPHSIAPATWAMELVVGAEIEDVPYLLDSAWPWAYSLVLVQPPGSWSEPGTQTMVLYRWRWSSGRSESDKVLVGRSENFAGEKSPASGRLCQTWHEQSWCGCSASNRG